MTCPHCARLLELHSHGATCIACGYARSASPTELCKALCARAIAVGCSKDSLLAFLEERLTPRDYRLST